MSGYLSEIRSEMIENLQVSLRSIRLLMGYSASELASFIGVSRQTISKLETGKTKLSPVQFISIAAVIDNYVSVNGEMFQAIKAILDGDKTGVLHSYDSSFNEESLLKRWFDTFESSECISSVLDSRFGDDFELLERIVGNYRVFLDDSIFLSDSAEDFIQALEQQLVFKSTKAIIPLRAIEKIQSIEHEDLELYEYALRALELISSLQRSSVAEIRGEEDDPGVQDTLLQVFSKFHSTYRLCLFTQDKEFANKVLRLNHNQNQPCFDLIVGFVNEDGLLALYPDLNSEADSESAPSFPSIKEENRSDSEVISKESLEKEDSADSEAEDQDEDADSDKWTLD